MKSPHSEHRKSSLRFGSVLRARCPFCHTGAVMSGLFSIRPKCEVCDYNFHPENGFYLGAMALSYLLTAMFTIPPIVVLKLLEVDVRILIAVPFIEFIFLGTFLMLYSRVLWLHLEYQMTRRLK